jgi:uncharacterized Zn finger protein
VTRSTVQRSTIREPCPDVVFERGETDHAEGRVHDVDRVGDTVTATVEGSRSYDLAVDLGAEGFDPSCTCPYDGPGECKHVVALLLALADGMPPDAGDRFERVLAEVDDEALRSFVRDELATEPGMRERFLARFGTAGKSWEAYRDDVDRLFDEHATNYGVVVDAIDFGHLTDLADRYRERERYRDAIAVYRGLLAGLDDNDRRIDAAYDHYAGVLTSALDAYADCVAAADPEEVLDG